MRRGYIRERKKGPSVDEQRKALTAAGVPTDGDHPPVYIDTVPRRTRKALDNSMPQRARAINSLCKGDAVVVYDAAALGQTEGDILDALAAIGRRGASVVVCVPPGEYRCWYPDVLEAMALVSDGSKILARERARVRVGSGPKMGRPKKLTGNALILARDLWGKRELVSWQVAAEVKAQTGVDISIRTLLKVLGPKSDAVERAERKIR